MDFFRRDGPKSEVGGQMMHVVRHCERSAAIFEGYRE